MGWVFAFAFAGLALLALLATKRLSRTAVELTVAALLVGLTGYAWQGSPFLPGADVNALSMR